jgi:DNA polymerase-3 subunit gamma/tau
MLKLLEEPPKTTIFLLCTTELAKVPATIKSRCQIYSFNKISHKGIVDRLKYICDNEGYTLTK